MLVILLINFIIIVIGVLISLSFLTLVERKLLGYVQIRKGPNKVGVLGIFQPFSDAFKLFSKELVFSNSFNKYLYFFSSIMILVYMLFGWLIFLLFMKVFIFELSLLFLFVFFGLSIYLTIFMGWSSNSLYSLMGMLRGIVQSVSYEVSLMLLLTLLIFIEMDFSVYSLMNFNQSNFMIYNYLSILSFMFFISILGEMNRTPFDFLEGESELVSGFNIEYSSSLFALIFMAEYGMIIFMSFLWSIFFWGGGVFNSCFFFIVGGLSLLIILIRGVLPRFRYDFMMMMFWKNILPIVLFYYLYLLGVLVY